MSKRRLISSKDLVTIITAVIGVLGTITVAYFSFRGNTAPLELVIGATQTAEAKTILLSPSATSTEAKTILLASSATSTPSPEQPIRLDARVWQSSLESELYEGEPKIKQNVSYTTLVDGITLFKSLDLPELLSAKGIHACALYTGEFAIEVGVTSQVTDEWIRFENTPLIKIDAVQPIIVSGTLHEINEASAGGGFVHPYEINLKLSDVARGTMMAISQDTSTIPDFYTLQPGEQEWLRIYMTCLEPGEYHVKAGITYTYQGLQETIWSSDTISVVSPERYYLWTKEIDYPNAYAFHGLVKWNTSTNEWQVIPAPFEQWLVP